MLIKVYRGRVIFYTRLSNVQIILFENLGYGYGAQMLVLAHAMFGVGYKLDVCFIGKHFL